MVTHVNQHPIYWLKRSGRFSIQKIEGVMTMTMNKTTWHVLKINDSYDNDEL